MRTLFAFAICLLTIGTVSAQDLTLAAWRLLAPDMETYLAGVEPLAEEARWMVQQSPNTDAGKIIDAIERDFLLRFGETADAETLSRVYDMLYMGHSGYANFSPFIYPVTWNMRIVERWLRDNPTDLEVTGVITFDAYEISVESIDFERDGEPEFFLTIKRTGEIAERYVNTFEHYWLAVADDTKAIGYSFSPLPVPYASANYWPAQKEWVGAELVQRGDITGDGIDEFVFRTVSVAPCSCSVATRSSIYILGYRNNALKILTASTGLSDYGEVSYGNTLINGNGEWTFQQLDTDPAHELAVTVRHEDNWQCVRYEYQNYDWNGEYLLRIWNANVTVPSINCVMRSATLAVRKMRFALAARLYEQAIAWHERLQATQPNVAADYDQMAAYARERLVLAYGFSNQLERAHALIEELAESPQEPLTMAAAYVELPSEARTPLGLCRAAYDALGAYVDATGWGVLYRGLVEPGNTDDEIRSRSGSAQPGSPLPMWDGCDLPGITERLIMETLYPITTLPIETLEAQGLAVAEVKLETDLNNDGNQDWILEVVDLGNLLFLSGDAFYTVSRASFSLPPSNMLITLPDGSKGLLGTLGESSGGCAFRDGSGGGVWDFVIHIYLIQFSGTSYQTTISGMLCAEIPNLEDAISPDRERLYLWIQEPYREQRYIPVEYRWDDSLGTYVVVTLADGERASSDEERPILTSRAFNTAYYAIHRTLFTEREYRRALAQIDAVLPLLDVTDERATEFFYWRAVALEQLGRSDDAAAAYGYVIETFPHTIYADLAALFVTTA